MRDREVALRAGIVGIGLGEALGNGHGGPVARHGLCKSALVSKHIADADSRPKNVAVGLVPVCRREHLLECRMRNDKLAGIQLQPAMRKLALWVRRIELDGLSVGEPGLHGVGQTGDGAEVAPGGGGLPPILVDETGLLFGDRSEQRSRLLWITLLQQLEGPRHSLVAGFRVFGSGLDRFGNLLSLVRYRRAG